MNVPRAERLELGAMFPTQIVLEKVLHDRHALILRHSYMYTISMHAHRCMEQMAPCTPSNYRFAFAGYFMVTDFAENPSRHHSSAYTCIHVHLDTWSLVFSTLRPLTLSAAGPRRALFGNSNSANYFVLAQLGDGDVQRHQSAAFQICSSKS